MAEPLPAPFTLTLSVDPPSPRAGEPVRGVLTLTNQDTETARVEHWSPGFEFEPEITGPDGRELPRTRFGNQGYRARDASVTATTMIPPGESYRAEVAYSRLFDLTLAGRYTLTVRRDLRAPASGEWVTVVSNTVTFSIEE